MIRIGFSDGLGLKTRALYPKESMETALTFTHPLSSRELIADAWVVFEK